MSRAAVLFAAGAGAAAVGAGGAWWVGRAERDAARAGTGATVSSPALGMSPTEANAAPTPAAAPATLAEYGPCGPVIQWCATSKDVPADAEASKACAAIRADVLGNLGRPSEKAATACRKVLPLLATVVTPAATKQDPSDHRTCAWIYKRCGEIDPNRSPVLAAVGGADFCGMLQFAYMMKKGTNAQMEKACAEIAHYFEPGGLPEIPAGMRATGGLFGRGFAEEPVYIETETTYETVEYYEDE